MLGKKVIAAMTSVPDWSREPAILLRPSIPKPMHGTAPRVVLGQAWWDKERKAAYASTAYHCLACGVHQSQAEYRKWLEGHELYAIDYRRGLMRYERTAPLCHLCHAYCHPGRLQALLAAGKITHAKFSAVVRHGDRVVKQAGLSRSAPYDGPVAAWGKWRLAIGRRRYKGKFKNAAEWLKYHEELNGVDGE